LNYNYQTNQNVESSNCSFTFGVVKDYTSSERLISEIAKYHNISNNISTTNADNGLIWNSLTYNENLISVYYDALENEGEVYLLSYEIQPSAEQAICDAFYKGILNSIEVK
jgi:hypothetical protein